MYESLIIVFTDSLVYRNLITLTHFLEIKKNRYLNLKNNLGTNVSILSIFRDWKSVLLMTFIILVIETNNFTCIVVLNNNKKLF